MNANETREEHEFVFQRLSESFPQFASELWQCMLAGPLWVLIVVALAVTARAAYAYQFRKIHGSAKPDATLYWLGWAVFASIATFVVWFIIEFNIRDGEQVKRANPALTSLSGSNNAMWYSFVAGIFALGSLFVIFMYIKDSRSVRWYWAGGLALLRMTVYALLCLVFLLPANETRYRTEKKSRVVVLIDITPSMTQKTDEVAVVGRKQRTRMDILIEFLTDEKIAFVQNLLKTNPIAVYPFGTRLDEGPRMISPGDKWGKSEWEAFARYDFRPFLLEGLSDTGKEALRASGDWARTDAGSPDWAASMFARQKDETWSINGMPGADMAKLRENIRKLDRRIDVARTLALGTNVPDSLLAALNRESPNMVQGIVLFSDGRSNLGSDSVYRELRERANKEKIPVFTVAVGQEDRQRPAITITDVQTDDIAPPDQGFKVSVEADGVNLAGRKVPVVLDLYYLGKDGKREMPPEPDYTLKTDTTKIPPQPYEIEFAAGDPPHGSVEFVVDPVKLAASDDKRARDLTETSEDTAIPKKVLKQGKWTVRARIARHEEETFADAEHIRERPNIQVMQKKLRVLVVAGAPSREFQFIRNFLAREVQDNRAEIVTLLVQNEAGTTGNLTPNPTERVIAHFPNRLDLTKQVDPKQPDPKGPVPKGLTPEEIEKLDKEKPYNLNEYDLIIAFDPDWSEISEQQAKDLQTWVETQGGGLIYVAGTVNTEQLARIPLDPNDKSPASRLRPILQLLPVDPDDIVANTIKGVPRTPRRLYLRPMPQSDLLKLYEPPTGDELTAYLATVPEGEQREKERKRLEKLAQNPIAGWERFFTDRDEYVENPDLKIERYPKRGFFSCYPIKDIKPGAKILAEFATVDEPSVDRRPWLVVNNPLNAWRTCFMGSGELYRMFSFDKEYYERLWGKLMKYMVSKRNKTASRGRVLVSKEVISGTPIRVKAQVLNTNSKPYPLEGPEKWDAKFYISRTLPDGKKVKEGPYEMTPVQGATGFDGYYQGQALAETSKFPTGEFDYTAYVEVPGSSDTLEAKFSIVRSDPELDNAQPDYTAMITMATEFDDAFQRRIPKEVSKEFDGNLPKQNGVQKLAFRIGDTSLLTQIPECFRTEERRADNRGQPNPLWDKGIDFPVRNSEGNFLERNVPESLSGKKFPVSWVLMVVVMLLCVEWTTRKLLRLA